ncbi:hypothetical protein R3P38DRAFT_2795106 [Favolaschia claudopus]|uniref:Uncharacterized protein n=1 Tax=Favolaschia claudopus TaxID=2862362 RepID=A0AAW0A7H8_9AGAR
MFPNLQVSEDFSQLALSPSQQSLSTALEFPESLSANSSTWTQTMDDMTLSAHPGLPTTPSTLKSTPGNSPLLLQHCGRLQGGNQAYIALMMERNILQGQLAESRDNYQSLLARVHPESPPLSISDPQYVNTF